MAARRRRAARSAASAHDSDVADLRPGEFDAAPAQSDCLDAAVDTEIRRSQRSTQPSRTTRQRSPASSPPGDWPSFADLFTEDATYEEHAFGTFAGREAIRSWVVQDDDVLPGEHDDQLPDGLARGGRPHPPGDLRGPQPDARPGDGSVHEESNLTILTYAGDGLWSREEDIYNPMRFATMTLGGRGSPGSTATCPRRVSSSWLSSGRLSVLGPQLLLHHGEGDRAGVALAGQHPDQATHGLVVLEVAHRAELAAHQRAGGLDLVVGIHLVHGLPDDLVVDPLAAQLLRQRPASQPLAGLTLRHPLAGEGGVIDQARPPRTGRGGGWRCRRGRCAS